ncbi:TPA: NAD(P)(+) transhydrogenase (Re/Si-specific) subunit beta [Stenotrophomonas maltophilia]|uniref:NAD(P)(+) transhydrogenase (Re/Si-specific) subunit beta n=1 Tax=unclassified Stenotrophomonas TaxID=196198 RepID=UPI00244A53AE|nr:MULTISPECIES: NAD(P)(+) transhydrogenase (Re/Si-specific) subunit beta [unclassified Stenotrophomonas]HDS1366075.1 NAD(P)(+) transhydrogenase (Re/Si-specific) subunit beta [Stenotrophomonas maltophilia]MDH0190168.1 NAD(P)(+) transhydrogenase (Re/Si-specific) subunit beta [Stenotrophomonas sp. GD04051]MDH0463926.1 NAD(P)(+) transhydrogenase (Re/Si-specific) subunit beta [Stenotrophomonas sp. GD03993]MDH0874548.1 NAD(P)(+) transhydrogenase (Re/Si-specific) subunit beta [Stenotrophomonas sp. GD
MAALLVALSGFVAAMLFVIGLKRMSSPVTASHGIVLAGIGMLLAVIASFGYLADVDEAARPHLATNLGLSFLALALGGILAWRSGRKVAVTGMPQMVALYNGMGGGSAAALAAVELLRGGHTGGSLHLSVTALGALIGSISLSGSVIAWAKLDGRINKPWRFAGQRALNGLVFACALAIGVFLVMCPSVSIVWPTLFFVAALTFGVLMTLPIGGADMPVVISLYNAFTGLAVGLEGFALQNPALMIAGMVVGSAGTLLTFMMARAMNRSLANVLFSNFGESAATGDVEVAGRMTSVDPSDAAVSMRYASSVIIVPGYGLAVAQAQALLYELVKLLQAADVDVKFAIHPVAGRMPGHMNVLLAEAGVPYDLIFDMEDINDSFPATDVALVIGANDVVNPAARSDKGSPIYGMPILDVDKAHQAYVIKRGQGKGYAGVENLLFYQDNCDMVYGDAQIVLTKMVQAIKDLAA